MIRVLGWSKWLSVALSVLLVGAMYAQQGHPHINPPVPVRVGPPRADAVVQRRTGPGLYAPPVPAGTLSYPDLRYRILEYFGDAWFCDPQAFFVERGWERSQALQALPLIRSDSETYRSIARHLGIDSAGQLSDEQTVAIYRQYKELHSAVRLDPRGERFRFAIATKKNNEDRAIQGDIDRFGQITILKNEPTFLACQICLPDTTQVETPKGSIPVRDLKPDMPIWTWNAKGERIEAPILKVSRVPISPEHHLVHLLLSDGRDVWSSPGRFYGAGNERPESVPHEGETCDILPGGVTGFYSGVLFNVPSLLESTLR